ASATSTNIVLTGFDRPFLGATSAIDYTSTTTVTASVPANATSSFDSVPMDIPPSSGSVAVTINTWDISGDYSKEWVETGDTPTATAIHVIGNLKPNTYYSVKVDNGTTFSNTYLSDSSGNITFTYSGGYSTHTFDVTEGSAPISTTPVSTAPTVSYSSGGGSVSSAVLATLLAPGASTTAYLNSINAPSFVPGCPAGFTCTPIVNTALQFYLF